MLIPNKKKNKKNKIKKQEFKTVFITGHQIKLIIITAAAAEADIIISSNTKTVNYQKYITLPWINRKFVFPFSETV